ncbi:T9SS type A sorting domain-containing protein [Aquimarina sp. 2201CG14-23]|uniref:T9SS type A sorting domain-containing protein n=1 Tax=Aquimarina mycalae TaxID=3040073 RepID=UPI002477D584|nr:T9SS type A sorting domain-containing protein [Aquimarina sp. 2201CG14-23]MDH7448067.1 T9SS type A sorting domain-containing protein [Aquimarina sp. 2201CG14-23]
MRFFSIIFVLLIHLVPQAQVTLNADGAGNTYELINSVLAPGANVIEAPGVTGSTCDNHSTYAGTDGNRHIDEVFDTDLGIQVFRFIIHVQEDIDRDKCTTTDRQRNEIKTYAPSPDNLKGTLGETVQYQWKFKLDTNFQPSGSFTHLHQLKSVGADTAEESQPLITLTARKGNEDQLELRYAPTTSQSTLTSVNLSLLKGNWVEVTETVTYGETNNAIYNILITNVNTGAEILNYSSSELRMWKTNADFIRPKWGIYRSLNSPSDLRDEEVLYANFSIIENPQLSIPSISDSDLFDIFPNPTTGIINFNFSEIANNYNILIINGSGKIIKNLDQTNSNKKIDLTYLSNGLYFVKCIDKMKNTFTIKKIVKAN